MTISLSTADVARKYVELVGSHDLEPLQELFADNLTAKVGDDSFDKAAWIAALGRFLPALIRNDVRHVFADGNDAAVIYDFVTDSPAGAVPCVETVSVEAGKIASIHLIFERLHWQEFLNTLRERANRTT